MKTNLSIIVLTHNDELRIVDCLESIVGLGDELIIVDDMSTDRTTQLVASFTKNIFSHALHGNYANQRNFALNHAHGTWVLFVDSDEVLSPGLKREITNAISKNQCEGYFIKRIDYMWGEKILYGEAGNVKLLRLAKNGFGKWRGKVHEEWKIKGRIGVLEAPIYHMPHPTVKAFINEVDAYSSLRAEELKDRGEKTNLVSIIAYPSAKFLQNYVFKKGYKDGVPGFLYALIMSLHSFLVRGKLYLMQNSRSNSI